MRYLYFQYKSMKNYRVLVNIYEQSKVSINISSISIKFYWNYMIFNQKLWKYWFSIEIYKIFIFSIQINERLQIVNQNLWKIKGFYINFICLNWIVLKLHDFQSKYMKTHWFSIKIYEIFICFNTNQLTTTDV